MEVEKMCPLLSGAVAIAMIHNPVFAATIPTGDMANATKCVYEECAWYDKHYGVCGVIHHE